MVRMSERQLATVRRIVAVDPIPGADAIEVATVSGWKVVIKKGEFVPGDLAVYCEIDSFLPIRPEYEFLRKSSLRRMGGLEPRGDPRGPARGAVSARGRKRA